MTHVGFHEPTFVLLSILIAVMASYTALDLAARMRAASGWRRFAWLIASAVVMGGGIWSMHFVAMLAFTIQGVSISYDPGLTTFSLLLPIVVTAVAFTAMNHLNSPVAGLAVGGMIMGLGVAAMHYSGMAAMRMSVTIGYSQFWVATSIFIAVGAATAALWISARDTSLVQRFGASLVMGVAIAGMHYSAMQGLSFDKAAPSALNETTVGQEQFATWITAATLFILLVAIVAAAIDRQLATRSAREATALRQSEERFRMLLESLSDFAIIMLDREGHVTTWNASAERIKGYKETEILGRHFSVFYTPEDKNTGLPHVALSDADRVGRFEHVGWRVRKDASRFWANVVICPIRDSNSALLGYAKITRDLTSQRETEEALERTREALFQAQKMEAVGQLTGGVAHDFNNLLMAITSSLELVAKRLPDDERLGRLIGNAMKGAQRGIALTQRMLAFARRQELKPSPVDVRSLVVNMKDIFDRSVDAATEIITRFPDKLPHAMVDSHQLELALLNLVVNARDALPEGGRVTISADEQWSDGRHFVRVCVADTGEGMSEKTLARALDPFFTTKGVGKGTGLGLPMVLGVAEQSGGYLKMASQLGKGTTAEIWLPATSAPVDTPQAAVAPQTNVPLLDGKHHVLVVDDDPIVLENTCEMLKELGQQVYPARSGHEALRVLDEFPSIDLVITDQAMPGMTGADLLKMIEDRKPHVIRILASGYVEAPTATGGLAARLTKPFNQATLESALVAATERHERATRSAPRDRTRAGVSQES